MSTRALVILSSACLLASCASVAERDSLAPSRSTADTQPHPTGMAYATYAIGKSKAEVSSGNVSLSDDTGAGMARLFLDAGGEHFGGGVHIDWSNSKDELFGDTQLTTLEIFPFFTYRPTAGDRFRAPIRVGPDFQIQHAEDKQLSPGDISETDFATVGGMVEAEPEFDFFRNGKQALSIYGSLRGGLGTAKAKLTDPNEDTTFDTKSTSFGAEVGLRYEIGKFLLTGGFLTRNTKYKESDPATFQGSSQTVPETDIRYTGFFFGGGVRW